MLGLTLMIHSCQENEISELELADKEILEAEQAMEAYVESAIANTSDGRLRNRWFNSKRCITVLKWKEGNDDEPGQLLYNTNRDDIRGFRPVDEQTVTAIVEPGEFIFWYAGAGVRELSGIEFVPDSQSNLGELPTDLRRFRLWFVYIPNDIESEELKYDILYRLRDGDDDDEDPIRLDPKITIKK